jgi:queuine/archaeosine tRNA-ribosyltransferase
LRHLFQAEEMLGYRLMTMHNLFFYHDLLGRVREAIRSGGFASFARELLAGPLGADPGGPPGGGRGGGGGGRERGSPE